MPRVVILTLLKETSSNSENGSQVVVPHQWNFAEICSLIAARNLSQGYLRMLYTEMSHRKHSNVLLLGRSCWPTSAADHNALYQLGTGEAVWGADMVLEKPLPQKGPAVPAARNQQAKLSPCNVSGAP